MMLELIGDLYEGSTSFEISCFDAAVEQSTDEWRLEYVSGV